MKIIIRLIFLIAILSSSAFAQEEQPTSSFIIDDNQQLSLRLMVYTTLEESILLDQKLHPDEETFIESEEWGQVVKDELTPLLTMEQINFTNEHPEIWKKASRGLGKKFSKLIKSFRTTSRLNGFDVGLMFVLGKSFEYALPGILLDMGLPGLATASLFIPIGTAIAAGYSLVKKMIKNQKIKKLYGGKDNFKTFKMIEESLEQNLNLAKKGTLLLPFIDTKGNYKGLAINSSFSLKKDFITYTALKRFLKQENKKDYIDLVQSKEYTSLSKVAKLVNKIYENSLDKSLQEKFEARFSYAIIELRSLNDYAPLVKWSISSALSRNCSELVQSIHNVPNGSSLNAVARLLEKVTLPFMAQTWSGTKFKFFKKLHDVFTKLRIESNLSSESKWSHDHEIHFADDIASVCTY